MPIFLILFVTAACLPVGWPTPPGGVSPVGVMLGTFGLTLLPVLAAAAAARVTVATLRQNPDLRSAAAVRFGRLRRLVLVMNFACFAGDLIGLGWGWLIWHEMTWDGVLAPFAELLVPLPFLLVLAVNWMVYYPADRAILTAGNASRSYPGRVVHWLALARRFALFVLVPAGLFAAEQSVSRFAPKEWQESPWFYLVGFGVVAGVLVLMPVAMTWVLGMRPMPPGPRRDRFAALARRLNVRIRDVLVWPTHHTLATAVMIGVVPRLRYVAFSDRLLEELTDEELDAVFGHEVGHVKHGHVPFYLVFLLLSSAVVTAAVAAVGSFLPGVRELIVGSLLEDLVIVVPLIVFGVYLFVAFGWLSRKCERQADLYGARAVSCGRPDCAVHAPEDYPARGVAPMCPTGIRIFVNALQQVSFVNGLDPIAGEHPSFLQAAWAWVRSWQHGPIPARIAFLRTLLVDPAAERKAQRRIALVRWGLVATLMTVAVLFGTRIGWTDLWTGM
jgi:Zn-dependent protease with chaperone function